MPRHVSIQPGQLYPQPDYCISVDREGKWTATQVFLCHRSSVTKLMPRPGTPHPEIPFITIDSVTAQVSEGDLAQITCNYAGTDNASMGAVPAVKHPDLFWRTKQRVTGSEFTGPTSRGGRI